MECLFYTITGMIVTIDELATLVAFCDLQKEPVLCQQNILFVDYHANSAGQNEGDFCLVGGEGGVHEADMSKSDDDIDLRLKHG